MSKRHLILVGGLTLALLLIPVRSYRRLVPLPPEKTIQALITHDDEAFHRALLEKYAQDLNLDIVVHIGDTLPADSLLNGALDLAIVPEEEGIVEGLTCSRAFADGTVWVVRSSETEGLRNINRWITELTASERFNRMQRRYLSGKPVNLQAISAYDGIIRQKADSVGWDWRLLAAVIYHESRFHNTASSSKGAMGLMQIRSSRYTPEQLLNPSFNISVGARYLLKLQKMFSADAADDMEARKFALAAYNLGEGKIGQYRDAAREAGLDASRWDNVATLLPAGHHTVSYVENVLDTYAYYSRLYSR